MLLLKNKYVKKLLLVNSIILSFTNSIAQNSKLLFKPNPVKETYHGIEVIDEYRNLENLKDTLVIDWMTKNSNHTTHILNSIPSRENFYHRFKKVDGNGDYYSSILVLENNLHVYTKVTSQSKYLICTRNGFNGKEKIVFDIDAYNKINNTKKVISTYTPNHSGTKLAIALTEGGTEIAEIVFWDIKSKKILPYVLKNTWPSDIGGINWLEDDSGIIYVYIPVIDNKSKDFIKNTKSVIYKLGDPVNNITDIFSKESCPELNIKREDFPSIKYFSKKHDFVLGNIGGTTNFNDTYYTKWSDVLSSKLTWKPFYKKEDKIKSIKILDNSKIIFISEKSGESAIYQTDLTNPDFSNAKLLVEEIKNENLISLTPLKDDFLFTTKKNGVLTKVYRYLQNGYHEIKLPITSGSVKISKGIGERDELWMYLSGWSKHRTRYKYNVNEQKFILEDFNSNELSSTYDDIVINEIEIKAHDGVDLPLTIIHKKDLIKNNQNRTLIMGYGSYGISNSPHFNPYILQWVIDGGVVVYTHVRGGGEKGDKWHKGGYKETKPNSWKDFITSTEHLINQGYTNPQMIGIYGGSAGGILMGRAITERPDLFKAAFINVGILNTLRFETTPNGKNNVKEFGTVENETEFKALLEMDSYHHIQKGVKYPATLITAGMNDSRVISWIPAKFVAKLQAYNDGENPILFFADINGGHGAAQSLEKSYNNLADLFAFFYWQLGHPNSKLE